MEEINGQDHERTCLREARENQAAWEKWGPYLSERQRPIRLADVHKRKRDAAAD